MTKNIFPPSISMCAITLESLGINEVAFLEEHVFNAINWCKKNGKTILGGDVYKISSLGVEALDDSWYFEPENVTSDYDNSCRMAVEYISKYIKRNRGQYAFSLVIKKD